VIVLLALAIVVLAASPAHAGRAYGVLSPGASLLTFEVEGGALKAAALRLTLSCDDGESIDFAANFRFSRPDRGGDAFLIRERARRNALRYRIFSQWGRGLDAWHWRGMLRVSRLDERKPRVHLMLREFDRTSTCEARITRLARNEPGVLYTGGTDDDEPVWLRRLPSGVEWVNGFGTECGDDDFMQGLYADFLPFDGPESFGRAGLIGGFQVAGREIAVGLGGVLGPSQADGTLRLRAARDCDTGERRWRAATG
jgi:hypothetical protein